MLKHLEAQHNCQLPLRPHKDSGHTISDDDNSMDQEIQLMRLAWLLQNAVAGALVVLINLRRMLEVRIL